MLRHIVMLSRLVVVPVLALAAVFAAGCGEEPATEHAGVVQRGVAASTAPLATPVTLRFFHCGVEPLRLYGELWVVQDASFDDVSRPLDLSGTGVVAREVDHLNYRDVAGGRLRFKLVATGHPPLCD